MIFGIYVNIWAVVARCATTHDQSISFLNRIEISTMVSFGVGSVPLGTIDFGSWSSCGDSVILIVLCAPGVEVTAIGSGKVSVVPFAVDGLALDRPLPVDDEDG